MPSKLAALLTAKGRRGKGKKPSDPEQQLEKEFAKLQSTLEKRSRPCKQCKAMHPPNSGCRRESGGGESGRDSLTAVRVSSIMSVETARLSPESTRSPPSVQPLHDSQEGDCDRTPLLSPHTPIMKAPPRTAQDSHILMAGTSQGPGASTEFNRVYSEEIRTRSDWKDDVGALRRARTETPPATSPLASPAMRRARQAHRDVPRDGQHAPRSIRNTPVRGFVSMQ